MNDSTNDGPASPSSSATGAENESAPACQITIPDAVFPKRNVFSSWYTRKVTKTVNIDGRLPNALFTLPTHLIRAVVRTAAIDGAARREFHAICRKFLLAEEDGRCSVQTFVNDGTTMALDCGRLFSSGNNSFGQCGVVSEEDEVTGPRHVRLPPVLRLWCDTCGYLALSTRGMYAWGSNNRGRLGLGDVGGHIVVPSRVPVPGDGINVNAMPTAVFIRTTSGWYGCGDNSRGQLGIGSTRAVTTPTPIPGSEGVTRWRTTGFVTFSFAVSGLKATGGNRLGQCGVGREDVVISTLSPVTLPDDFKGRVDRILTNHDSSFFLSGRRCFGCGCNEYGELGVGSDTKEVRTPLEVRVPVDDVMSWCGQTVIRSGGALFCCGDNSMTQIHSDGTDDITSPVPIDLPGPVVAVAVIGDNIFVQLKDGAWVGRGGAMVTVFETQASRHSDLGRLPGWTKSSVFDRAFALEAGARVMTLPEPVGSTEALRGWHGRCAAI